MNSLWLSENLNNDIFQKLDKDIYTDVCIIGAGIFGLTSAYYLSNSGLKVTVIDKSDIGRKTTGHTTAKITSQHGLFYTYLINTYGEQFAKDYLFANEEAIQNIKNIIDTENIKCDFEKQSNFVYTTNKHEIDNIKKEVDCVNCIGFPANFVTKVGLPFEIAGAIQFKNQAQFNPIKYINGLCNCIIKNNGKIYTNTTVYDVKKDANNFSTLTVGGTIHSKYVILASHYPFINFPGIYFFKMYQSTSYVIGIDTKKTLFNGMYITASEPTYSFRTANYQGKKILLLGGCGHKTGVPVSYSQSYATLENYAKQLYPNCEILFRWDTRDCISLDKIPYIGAFSTSFDNFYVGTGFNKWGMTSAMVSAMIISDFILGKDNDFSEIFSPKRFDLSLSINNIANDLVKTAKNFIAQKISIPSSEIQHIKNGHAGIVDYNGQKVGVYKDENGKEFIVSTKCSHLGCELHWNADELTWDCPCHGSRFDYTGKLIESPANKDIGGD